MKPGDRVEYSPEAIARGFTCPKGTKTGTVTKVNKEGLLVIHRDGYSPFSDHTWYPDFWQPISTPSSGFNEPDAAPDSPATEGVRA